MIGSVFFFLVFSGVWLLVLSGVVKALRTGANVTGGLFLAIGIPILLAVWVWNVKGGIRDLKARDDES